MCKLVIFVSIIGLSSEFAVTLRYQFFIVLLQTNIIVAISNQRGIRIRYMSFIVKNS